MIVSLGINSNSEASYPIDYLFVRLSDTLGLGFTSFAQFGPIYILLFWKSIILRFGKLYKLPVPFLSLTLKARPSHL